MPRSHPAERHGQKQTNGSVHHTLHRHVHSLDPRRPHDDDHDDDDNDGTPSHSSSRHWPGVLDDSPKVAATRVEPSRSATRPSSSSSSSSRPVSLDAGLGRSSRSARSHTMMTPGPLGDDTGHGFDPRRPRLAPRALPTKEEDLMYDSFTNDEAGEALRPSLSRLGSAAQVASEDGFEENEVLDDIDSREHAWDPYRTRPSRAPDVRHRLRSEQPDDEEFIEYARWDVLHSAELGRPTDVLLLGYRDGFRIFSRGVSAFPESSSPGGFMHFDSAAVAEEKEGNPSVRATANGESAEMFELANVRRGSVGRVIGAKVLPAPPSVNVTSSCDKDLRGPKAEDTAEEDVYSASRPLIALVSSVPHDADSPTSVVIYSLKDHEVVKRIPLCQQRRANKGRAVESDGGYGFTNAEIDANERVFIVATSAPPTLHVFSLDTLEPLCSPLMDIAPHPLTSLPIFALGDSRLLAYGTSRAPTGSSSRSRRHPANDIIARKDYFTSPSSVSAAVASPSIFLQSTTSQATAAAAQAASAAAHAARSTGAFEPDAKVGDVAKKVGEGLMSGMRSLSGWGRGYLAGVKASSGFVPGPELKKTLSKSAPQPTTLGAAFSPVKPSFGTTARGGSTGLVSSSLSSSHGVGSVVVLDLFAGPVSTAGNQSLSPMAVAHFRPAHIPLARLSFNPTGSLLFVADALGNTFHIFELRPPGRSFAPSHRGRAQLHGHRRGASDVASAVAGTDTGALPPPVWHRYKLFRGLTPAIVRDVKWSADSQWLGVCTAKGTVHLYAVNLYGGNPHVEGHLHGRVANTNRLMGLSVGLKAVGRTKPAADVNRAYAAQDSEDKDAMAYKPPPLPAASAFLLLSPSRGQLLQGSDDSGLTVPASPTAVHAGLQALSRLSAVVARSAGTRLGLPSAPLVQEDRLLPGAAEKALLGRQELLVFHPSQRSLGLHRLTFARAPAPASTAANFSPAALSAAAFGTSPRSVSASNSAAGSPRISDLQGGGRGRSSSGLTQALHHGTSSATAGQRAATLRRDEDEDGLVGEMKMVGIWELARDDERGQKENRRLTAVERREGLERSPSSQGAGPAYWVSKAEIETFSRSSKMLPTPIYLSHQFTFHAYDSADMSTASKGSDAGLFAIVNVDSRLHRIDVRKEVEVRAGETLANSEDAGHVGTGRRRGHDGEKDSLGPSPSSFDEPIASAMASGLDPEMAMLSRSPNSMIPWWANGQPGRALRWTDGIPIRSVAGGINQGVRSAWKELDRVRAARTLTVSSRSVASDLEHGQAKAREEARQRQQQQQQVGADLHDDRPSTVDFEDEDAVFPEMLPPSVPAEAASDADVDPGSSLGAEHAGRFGSPVGLGIRGQEESGSADSAGTLFTNVSDYDDDDGGDDGWGDFFEAAGLTPPVPSGKTRSRAPSRVVERTRGGALDDGMDPLDVADDFTVGVFDEEEEGRRVHLNRHQQQRSSPCEQQQQQHQQVQQQQRQRQKLAYSVHATPSSRRLSPVGKASADAGAGDSFSSNSPTEQEPPFSESRPPSRASKNDGDGPGSGLGSAKKADFHGAPEQQQQQHGGSPKKKNKKKARSGQSSRAQTPLPS